ncbi:hypothetical protein ACFFWC_13650 [Plantactinospora siamensis]|uniref:Uncharacterized protein n=1 Tax=Plantactinospora siamensis TaxID=555372 RepID=A0ABV6P408_9ACTN
MSDPVRTSGEPTAVPEGVTDSLLWRLATRVAAEHRLDADGRCHNLQCHSTEGPCAAARWAERALRVSGGAPAHPDVHAGGAASGGAARPAARTEAPAAWSAPRSSAA